MTGVMLKYPQTTQGPAPLIDLNSKAERERLSPGALKGFFNIIDRWSIRDEDARALLGGLSNGPYYTWKKQPVRLLGTDVLARISYLVGIFKALHILYGPKLADEWVMLPNTNRILRRRDSAGLHETGGHPRYAGGPQTLDARRGGV